MAFAASTAPGLDHIKVSQTSSSLLARYARLAKQEDILTKKMGQLQNAGANLSYVGQGQEPIVAAPESYSFDDDDDDDDDDDAIISKESSKNAKRPSSGSVKEPQAKQERRETVYIAESPEY
eukprot:m.226643 g.226643  ORF g.226643 m.226643 type:complete len:122 (-) comp17314_c1_seq3:82-447(-)